MDYLSLGVRDKLLSGPRERADHLYSTHYFVPKSLFFELAPCKEMPGGVKNSNALTVGNGAFKLLG